MNETQEPTTAGKEEEKRNGEKSVSWRTSCILLLFSLDVFFLHPVSTKQVKIKILRKVSSRETPVFISVPRFRLTFASRWSLMCVNHSRIYFRWEQNWICSMCDFPYLRCSSRNWLVQWMKFNVCVIHEMRCHTSRDCLNFDARKIMTNLTPSIPSRLFSVAPQCANRVLLIHVGISLARLIVSLVATRLRRIPRRDRLKKGWWIVGDYSRRWLKLNLSANDCC